MSKAVFRYEIPLDDKAHPIPPGMPVHFEVGRRIAHVGELWLEVYGGIPKSPTHEYQVFGTGHLIPDDFEFIGTAREDPFMWHLYRREIY